jgi:tRNA-specific 2-thiouridylase
MPRILTAMSGGVDSSAAALLLQRQGHQVEGATFVLRDDIKEAVRSAARVCGQLGIPHHVFDFRDDFEKLVLEPFARGYREGLTPNPCVYCNIGVKFGLFLQRALEMGFDAVATGHYARLRREADGVFRLYRGRDPRKDQSYVLYHLTQEQLAHILFPLGELEKNEVRALAAEAGLGSAQKAESQDICFVPDGDYAGFIERYTGRSFAPGDFVDENGRPIGRHKGIGRYTLGQRRGLGIGFGRRVFVSGMDARRNTVTLSGESALLARRLTAAELRVIDPAELRTPARLDARIRYAHPGAPALVTPLGDTARVLFDEPQRAITPGQAVVFYDGDRLVGGGVIDAVQTT